MSSVLDLLNLRRAAINSLQDLYEKAHDVARLHSEAGMEVPDEVKGMLRSVGPSPKPASAISVSRTWVIPESPVAVPTPGLISVRLKDLMTNSRVKIALRGSSQPVSLSDVLQRVRLHQPDMSYSAIHQAAAKLQKNSVITHDKSGLKLINESSAPFVLDGRAWGTPDTFDAREIAAHRREAEVECIAKNGDLKRHEIVSLLAQMDWVHAPLHDALIKADLEVLREAGIIERDVSGQVPVFRIAPEKGASVLKLAR